MRHILALILILFIALGLCSCNEEKQAAKKTSWLLAHDKMAEECSRLYPSKDSVIVKDSLSFDTLYKEGEIIYDTIAGKDSIIYREHKCPPNQIIIQKQRHDSTIYRSNTAEAERWRSLAMEKDRQLQAKDNIIIKLQNEAKTDDKWKLYFFILLFANVLGLVFRFFVIKKPL